jgi:hypothetical protein
MNANRLNDTLKFLISLDADLRIQQLLAEVGGAVDELVNQPNHPQHQAALANSLEALNQGLRLLDEKITPTQLEALEELGGREFFDASMGEKIIRAVAQNTITPAMVRDLVQDLLNRRQTYLTHLHSTQRGLEALGIKGDSPRPGEAELAFLIPRAIFNNHLEDLSKELHTINRIIRFFSEVVTGHPEDAEVHQIASSIPTFVLGGLDLQTILAIGGAITWLLNTWKQAEDIKKVRADSKKLALPEAFIQTFQTHIDQLIGQAIEKHARELMERYEGDVQRRNELENGLRWSMESLLARIERGMTVEVRFIEPPSAQDDAKSAVYSDLRTASKALQFPVMAQEPVLKLPPYDPPTLGVSSATI